MLAALGLPAELAQASIRFGLGRAKGSGGLWNNSAGSPGKDPSKKMDKPLGEWNSFHIKMIGERVTVISSVDRWVYALDTRSGELFRRFRGTDAFGVGPLRCHLQWRNL